MVFDSESPSTENSGRPESAGPAHAADATVDSAGEQAERLRAILDTAVDGIITIDDRGRMESVNRAAEVIFRYSAAELLGQNVSMLMPEPDHSQHDGYIEKYLLSREPHIIGSGREVRGKRKDGSVFPMYLAVSEVVLPDRLMFTGIVRDLTEQRKIEAELKQRDEQVEFMIEHLPAGAVYVERTREEIFCNPTVERITGYPREQLASFESWFETLFGKDAAAVRAIYEEDREDHFELVRTIPFRHADGSERSMEISGYRYNNHEVWLVRDVTEHREAERRALQSERLAAIGQMVTGLAHESRNALQRAQAGLDVLSLDVADPQQVLVSGIRRALSDLTTLYEEVRQYASPIHLRRKRVPLAQVWRAAWQSLAGRLEDKPLRLIEVDDDHPELTCDVDPFRMEQVFRNIFENAIDAAPSGSAITVTISKPSGEPDTVLVVIEDEGPGLDLSQQSRVFEPFFTTKQKGTGLGMAIVARIIELHRGRVVVGQSERGGALFKIRLPIEESNGQRKLEESGST